MFGHWNIRGLTSKKLERIKQTDNFDVLGIAKTWKSVEETLNIEGYEEFKVYREKSRNSRTYGGLYVFVKEERLLQLKGYLVNLRMLCGLCFV